MAKIPKILRRLRCIPIHFLPFFKSFFLVVSMNSHINQQKNKQCFDMPPFVVAQRADKARIGAKMARVFKSAHTTVSTVTVSLSFGHEGQRGEALNNCHKKDFFFHLSCSLWIVFESEQMWGWNLPFVTSKATNLARPAQAKNVFSQNFSKKSSQ